MSKKKPTLSDQIKAKLVTDFDRIAIESDSGHLAGVISECANHAVGIIQRLAVACDTAAKDYELTAKALAETNPEGAKSFADMASFLRRRIAEATN